MKKITIHLIAAARPNFMKVAPVYHALRKEQWAEIYIVHTGQHYDINMSDSFFKDLNMPEPHIHLGVGSGSHAEQTGNVMIAYEKILLQHRPDMVIVVGDVNSTMAATIAAAKLGIRVAHLEAGLRSFDRSMPEEINRLVTDSIADILLTPSPDGDENLLKEGISSSKIFRVGNIMIDSLEMLRPVIEKQDSYKEFGLSKGAYGLITLHRPSNVDHLKKLESICKVLTKISIAKKLIFPIHPRTHKKLSEFGLLSNLENSPNILLTPPLNYIRFMSAVFNCSFVITDSGGIQEETTYLGIPCFTLRPNTERPVTITSGTNRLCTIENLAQQVEEILSKSVKHRIPDMWDGKTAQRIVDVLKQNLQGAQNHVAFYE